MPGCLPSSTCGGSLPTPPTHPQGPPRLPLLPHRAHALPLADPTKRPGPGGCVQNLK